MSKNFKILVVDDDLKNIQVGINFLKKNSNYHLVFATSGEQALERIKETDFDLVLLDIIMPTIDGYEVCRQLKADDKTRHIPVIFLTAKHEEDSLMKGFEVGGADYITKPFNASELKARVKTHLDLNYHYKQEIVRLQELLICSQQAETINFIAAGIAHDSNNFITAITGNMEMLKLRLRADGLTVADYRDFFDGADVAVKKISGLLDQFSVYASKNKAIQEVVDMNEVVADLQKVYKGYATHNIKFETNFHCQPALVKGNKLHIEQVLLNIIINAQHAILDRWGNVPKNGLIDLNIEGCDGLQHSDLVDEYSYIKVTVSDNGIGMSSETVEKIFDPYFSTRLDQGGTGLGLAVTMEIIQSHKGVIDVSSQLGKGTTFNIYLSQHIQ